MPNYNKVILMGRLTRDPELRYTKRGTACASFGIAVGQKRRDASGQYEEEVLYIDVEYFKKLAETIHQWFKKGDPILVDGRLRLDKWETREKEKRQKIKVIGFAFEFVQSRRTQEESGRDKPLNAPVPRPDDDMPAFENDQEIPY